MILTGKNDLAKALVIYEFMKQFNYLEKVIKNKFSELASKANDSEKNKLYFYHGGLIGRVYIDYSNDNLKFNEISFKTNEKFKNFTLNQILGILEKSKLKENFPDNINSIIYKRIEHSFLDSIKRIISMRNKLAHELVNLKFNDKDYIELLPIDVLEDRLDIQFDENYDEANQIQIIFSNIAYINIIVKKVQCFINPELQY